eukprot:gene3006-1988_t
MGGLVSFVCGNLWFDLYCDALTSVFGVLVITVVMMWYSLIVIYFNVESR